MKEKKPGSLTHHLFYHISGGEAFVLALAKTWEEPPNHSGRARALLAGDFIFFVIKFFHYLDFGAFTVLC